MIKFVCSPLFWAKIGSPLAGREAPNGYATVSFCAGNTSHSIMTSLVTLSLFLFDCYLGSCEVFMCSALCITHSLPHSVCMCVCVFSCCCRSTPTDLEAIRSRNDSAGPSSVTAQATRQPTASSVVYVHNV